jgi:hypothetical protein
MSAHGERAEKHGHYREYWSRRHPGMLNWGPIGKWLTHKRERAERKRLERAAAAEARAVLEGRTDD